MGKILRVVYSRGMELLVADTYEFPAHKHPTCILFVSLMSLLTLTASALRLDGSCCNMTPPPPQLYKCQEEPSPSMQ